MVKQPRSTGGKFAAPVAPEGTGDFEAYFRRVTAPVLQSAEPPSNWPYSTQSWSHWTAKALEYLRSKATLDWVIGLAIQGYRPRELARGELAPGAAVGANGRVQRPQQSELESATLQEARQLLSQVQTQRINLEPVLLVRLEHASRGYGSDKDARHLLRAVRNEVASEEARRAAQAREDQVHHVRIMVRQSFSAKGRDWVAGEHRVEQSVLDELENWKMLSEIQAQQHDWPAPEGFSVENWPPYEVLMTGSPRPVAKVAAPW